MNTAAIVSAVLGYTEMHRHPPQRAFVSIRDADALSGGDGQTHFLHGWCFGRETLGVLEWFVDPSMTVHDDIRFEP